MQMRIIVNNIFYYAIGFSWAAERVVVFLSGEFREIRMC